VRNGEVEILTGAGQNYGFPKTDALPGGRLGVARRQRKDIEFCVALECISEFGVLVVVSCNSNTNLGLLDRGLR